MKNASTKTVALSLAISKSEQMRGLSGLQPSQFKSKEGMLFINTNESSRTFWMNDTYFNLDIIFLDKNLKIVGLEKNVPFHKGSKEPPYIYRTQTYNAQFVLETKAKSEFSRFLKIGDQLKFVGKTTLSEIVSNARQPQ